MCGCWVLDTWLVWLNFLLTHFNLDFKSHAWLVATRTDSTNAEGKWRPVEAEIARELVQRREESLEYNRGLSKHFRDVQRKGPRWGIAMVLKWEHRKSIDNEEQSCKAGRPTNVKCDWEIGQKEGFIKTMIYSCDSCKAGTKRYPEACAPQIDIKCSGNSCLFLKDVQDRVSENSLRFECSAYGAFSNRCLKTSNFIQSRPCLVTGC